MRNKMPNLDKLYLPLISLAILIRTLQSQSWSTTAALIAVIAVYAFERREQAKSNETRELAKRVEQLAALQADVAIQAAETKKQHEEMKRVLSSSVLVNAFKPPVRRGQSNVITG